MRENRASLYVYILFKLSKDSLEGFKRHKNYEAIASHTDPHELLMAMIAIHQVTTQSNLSRYMVQNQAFKDCKALRQGKFQSTSEQQPCLSTICSSCLKKLSYYFYF